MKRWYVWGEYGPVAYDQIDTVVEAETEIEALNEAEKQFEQTPFWNNIGRHNMYALALAQDYERT